MPKGKKYIDLTRYLETCGQDELTMTFEQISRIVGGLPPAAYLYPAYWSNGSQGSFSFGWLNAGYKSKKLNFNAQTIGFYKDSDSSVLDLPLRSPQSTNKIQHNNRNISLATLDVNYAVSKIQKYYLTTQDNEHTRYRSWEHCYSVFSSCPANADDAHIDYLALHLAWYLASWGMLRNSFLMGHDYKIHKPLLSKLMTPHFMQLYSVNVNEKSVELTLEAAEIIKLSYPSASISDTLITKILLGVFGVSPAYDRFFKNAARKYAVCSGTFSEKSLRQLWAYYNAHVDALEQTRKELSAKGLQYPPMKLIDMCLWHIGYDDAGQPENTDE